MSYNLGRYKQKSQEKFLGIFEPQQRRSEIF